MVIASATLPKIENTPLGRPETVSTGWVIRFLPNLKGALAAVPTEVRNASVVLNSFNEAIA